MLEREFKWMTIAEGLPALNEWVLIADKDGHYARGCIILHNGHYEFVQDEPCLPVDSVYWWARVPHVPLTKSVP